LVTYYFRIFPKPGADTVFTPAKILAACYRKVAPPLRAYDFPIKKVLSRLRMKAPPQPEFAQPTPPHELRRLAMSRRRFAVGFMRWRAGRVQCAPAIPAKAKTAGFS